MPMRMTKREQLLRIRDEYRAAHSNEPATAREMADWAVAHGKYKLPDSATQRKCAEELADAMAMDMVTAPGGRRARTMHAWRQAQHTLWDDIRTISRENMSLSFAFKRNGMVGEVKQMKIDLDYYNDLHPDDGALQVSFNFENDLADAGLLNFAVTEIGKSPEPPRHTPPV